MNTFFKLNVLNKIFNKLKVLNCILLSIALTMLIHDIFILHIKWKVAQVNAYKYTQLSMDNLCKSYINELETLKLTYKNDDYMYIKQRESSLKVETRPLYKVQFVQEIHSKLNLMKPYNKNVSYNKLQSIYVRISDNCSLYMRWSYQREEDDSSIFHRVTIKLLDMYFKIRVRFAEMSVTSGN